MSNVVKFLEALGRNPALLTEDQYADAVAALELDAESAAALARRDATRIAELLEAPAVTFCGLFPAEEEQPVKEDEPDEDDRDAPEKDASARAA
ncbi:hypothetical protein [Marilutibacter spongiae]|uniref:Uncharacterized protein n=1 Tax=Marilutibacter spongiae TaxID=2025720 RepID=A0A7W3TKF8_9GAMM|nr:hypothetical protein [Lysobacter spongiae]MBB1059977.1 hypothetical protein [Lysobacter spongiae]